MMEDLAWSLEDLVSQKWDKILIQCLKLGKFQEDPLETSPEFYIHFQLNSELNNTYAHTQKWIISGRQTSTKREEFNEWITL